MTVLAQTLRAPAQAVVQSEPWLGRQRERLQELSQELGCVKGLAWPTRAPGVHEAEAQAFSAALLSQEAVRRAQVVTTVGGPDSLLGQAREARRWTERLLRGMGQPGGAAVWALGLKELVDKAQRLHPQLLRLLVTAGVVGGDGDHWGFAQARPLP